MYLQLYLSLYLSARGWAGVGVRENRPEQEESAPCNKWWARITKQGLLQIAPRLNNVLLERFQRTCYSIYADFNITVSNNMFCSVCRFWYFQRTLLSPDNRFWKSCSRLINEWRPVIFEDWPFIDFSYGSVSAGRERGAIFFVFESSLWPISSTFLRFLNCSEELLSLRV